MAEVAQQQVVTQGGVETTSGTKVAASKQFNMVNLSLGPKPVVKRFPGMGRRIDVATGINKNSSGGKLGGPANYSEMAYWCSAAWGPATITTPVGATLARKWAWDISLTAALGQKTFTIQQGSAVRAQDVGYFVVPDLGEKWGRDDVTLDGAWFAQNMGDNITLTSSPTIIPRIPQLGAHNSYYYDSTSAGLGGTQLLRVWDASWNWKSGVSPFWPQNRQLGNSFGGHVDTDPDIELTMLVEADAAGMAMYADLTSDARKYVRFEAIGPQIETGTPNQFYAKTLDIAVALTKEPKELGDEQGIRSIEFTLTPVEDTAWGFAMRYSLVNTLTAL